MRLLVVITILLLGISFAYPERRRTTRSNLHPREELEIKPGVTCWVRPDSARPAVRFCGYEKKQSATKETLFIENLTDSAIVQVDFTIQYFDTSNREIHRRNLTQPVDLPPRRTRRLDIRSWDTQKTYYYLGGPKPRTSATPYTVAVALDSLKLIPDSCNPNP